MTKWRESHDIPGGGGAGSCDVLLLTFPLPLDLSGGFFGNNLLRLAVKLKYGTVYRLPEWKLLQYLSSSSSSSSSEDEEELARAVGTVFTLKYLIDQNILQ